MAEYFGTATLVMASAAFNLVGVLLLRHAAETGSGLAAISGALAWAMTAAVFLALLRTQYPLAVLSTVTSAAGFLAVIAIGAAYGDSLSPRQALAIALMVLGMFLLSVPRNA